jgi:hypothetical protein
MPFTVSGRLTNYALTKHAIPPRHRQFSLSYSAEAGWDDPDSPALGAMRAETLDMDTIIHYPLPQNQSRIEPIFEDAPGESWVMSTVSATVWLVAERIKWESTAPLDEMLDEEADPLVEF